MYHRLQLEQRLGSMSRMKSGNLFPVPEHSKNAYPTERMFSFDISPTIDTLLRILYIPVIKATHAVLVTGFVFGMMAGNV